MEDRPARRGAALEGEDKEKDKVTFGADKEPMLAYVP